MTTNASRNHVVYYHGLPGSAHELALAGISGKHLPMVLPPLDIAAFDAHVGHHGPSSLVAFSLGAFSALTIAAARPSKVAQITLIAPGAPLDLGDFLPQMAGAPVFRVAKQSAILLCLLTAIQSLTAQLAPKTLINSLFAGTCDKEQALARDPAFIATMTASLRQSLGKNAASYQRTLRAYVQPWANHLSAIECPIVIHQGMQDTWVPPVMAEALAQALGGDTQLIRHEELGHFTTLVEALPGVLAGKATTAD